MRALLSLCCIFLIGCTSPQVMTPPSSSIPSKVAFLQSHEVQLNAPIIMIDSILFQTSAQISLDFDLEGAMIYYRIADQALKKYTTPFTIHQSTSIHAQARKKGFLDSEWIEQSCIKTNAKLQNATIQLIPEAHENYPGGGAQSLIDSQKGGLNFRANQAWLGFQDPQVSIHLDFHETIELATLSISALSQHDSWIFLPKRIEVWYDNQLLGSTSLKMPMAAQSSTLKIIPIKIQQGNYPTLRISILNHPAIPAWHTGHGNAPWLFIDEVFVE